MAAAGGNLELPHGPDGKLDYGTLGKMVTAHLLGEVLHASFIDPNHSKTPSVRADTDWELGSDLGPRTLHSINNPILVAKYEFEKTVGGLGNKFCYEKNNVTVLRKKSHHTCFMGRGVVDKPLKDLAEFYEDIQSTFLWDNLLVDAQYVRQLSKSSTHSDYIGYQMFETKQYCGLINLKRDMLYFVRCIYTEDGKYIQSGVSIEDPEFPPQLGVPRVDLHFGSGFLLEPYGNDESKTLISYLADLDVKQVPSLIMKQVLKCHPMSIQNVRKYFTNSPSSSPRHLRTRRTSDRHKFMSSISTSSSANLSPLRHSSRFYEEGTVTNDFLGFDQTAASIVRRPRTPLSIHSNEPLCFSTVDKLDKNDS